MKHFYTHVIEIDLVHKALDEIEMDDHERKELFLIAESGIHHVIIDAVLTELSEEDKKKFLENLEEEDHDKIWSHLKEKIDNIEEKIRDAAHGFIATLHQDTQKLHD